MNLNQINAVLADMKDASDAMLKADVKSYNWSVSHIGSKRSMETRAAMSAAAKGKVKTAAHREKLSAAKLGVSTGPRSDETKARMREAWKMRAPHPRTSCLHCGKESTINNINRWHNDNCNMRPTTFSELFGSTEQEQKALHDEEAQT